MEKVCDFCEVGMECFKYYLHELQAWKVKNRKMMTYKGVEAYFCAFLTSKLDGVEWSAS
jgi:hypothetical protein